MNILIVDDDRTATTKLQTFLTEWGHEVTSASNGVEGWNIFQQQFYPLVITDWMMPEMDGPQLVQKMRYGHAPGYVYIIMLTSKAGKEDLIAGMKAGPTILSRSHSTRMNCRSDCTPRNVCCC